MIPFRLFTRWKRNLMSVSAIAVSFAMVLSLSSITAGLHEISRERSESSPSDLVISSLRLEPSIECAHSASMRLLNDTRNFSAVMPLLTVLGTIGIPLNDSAPHPFSPFDDSESEIGGIEKEEIGFVGLVPELAEGFIEDSTLKIRSEKLRMEGWFDEHGDPMYDAGYGGGWTGEILLDDNIMKEHGLVPGDFVYYLDPDGVARSSFVIKGVIMTSLMGGGLSSQIVSGIALLHLSELQYLTGNHFRSSGLTNRSDLANAVYLDLQQGRKDASSLRDITMYLEGLFPGLKVTTKEYRIYRLEEEVLVLEIFSMGVGLSTLITGALFLASIMILDIEDRKGEIAIMRAIGISRRTIYLQILGDSMILALLGALLGLLPGYFGSEYLDRMLRSLYGVKLSFSVFSWELVMLTFLFLMFFVIISAVFPGLRSTSIELKRGLSHNLYR